MKQDVTHIHEHPPHYLRNGFKVLEDDITHEYEMPIDDMKEPSAWKKR